jgi:hypothetical protein
MAKKTATPQKSSVGPQTYYWDTFTRLKVDQEYLRQHEERLDSVERCFNIVSAVAASAAIGGWILWQNIQFVWAAIIAGSQVLSVVRPHLPYGQRLKALDNLCPDIESLVLGAERDWWKVSRGLLTEDEILDLATELKQRKAQAVRKHFKGLTLPENRKKLNVAEDRTRTYMQSLMEE